MNRSRSLHRLREPQIFRPWTLRRFRKGYWPNNLTNQSFSDARSDLITIQPWTFRIGFRNRQLINVSNGTANALNENIPVGDNSAASNSDANNVEHRDNTPPPNQPSLSNNDDSRTICALPVEEDSDDGTIRIRLEISIENRLSVIPEETEVHEFDGDVIDFGNEEASADEYLFINQLDPRSLFDTVSANGQIYMILTDDDDSVNPGGVGQGGGDSGS